MDGISLVISLVVFATALVAIVAGAYIYRVQGEIVDLPRYPYLVMLFARERRVVLGCSLIAAIVSYALLRTGLLTLGIADLPSLPAPWGAILIGGAVELMMLGPIFTALQFRRDRAVQD